jgi:hypothetical protein
MKSPTAHAACAITLAPLAACAFMPTGPSFAVRPGEGKSTEQFSTDNDVCRQSAADQSSKSVPASEPSFRYVTAGAQHAYDFSFAKCMSAKGNHAPEIQ